MNAANLHPLLLRRTGGTSNPTIGLKDQSWSMVAEPKTLSTSPASASHPSSPNLPPMTNSDNVDRAFYNHIGGRLLMSMTSPSATESYQDDDTAAFEANQVDSDVVDQRYDDDDDDEMNTGAGGGVSDGFRQPAAPKTAVISEQPASLSLAMSGNAVTNTKSIDNEYLRRLLDAAITPCNSNSAAQSSTSRQSSAPANDENLVGFTNFSLPSGPNIPRSTNKRKSSTPQCARPRETLSPDRNAMLAAVAADQHEQQQQQPPAIMALQQFAEAPPTATFALDNVMVADLPLASRPTPNRVENQVAESSAKPSVHQPPASALAVRKNYCETCEQFFSTPSNFRKHLKTLVHLTTKSRCEQQKQQQSNSDSPIRSLLNNNNSSNNRAPPSFSSRFPGPTPRSTIHQQQQQTNALQMLQARAAANARNDSGGGRSSVSNSRARTLDNNGGNWSPYEQTNPRTQFENERQPQTGEEDSNEIICTGTSFTNNSSKNYDNGDAREFFNNSGSSVDNVNHQPSDPSEAAVANIMNLLTAPNQPANVAVQQQLNLSLLALATVIPNLTQQLTLQLTRAIATAVTTAQEQQQQQQTTKNRAVENSSNNSGAGGIDLATLMQSLITSAINSTPKPQLPPQASTRKSSSVLIEMQSPPSTSSFSNQPMKKLSAPFFSNSDSPISASPILQPNQGDDEDNVEEDRELAFRSPTASTNTSNNNAVRTAGDADDDDEEGNQLIIDEDYEQSAKTASSLTSAVFSPTEQQSTRRRRSLFNTSTGGSADGMETYKSPGGEIITIEEPLMLSVPVNAPAGDISNRPCSIACGRCHKPFRTRTAYREHFRVVHVQHKPFSCSMCRKYFSCKSNYEKHMKTQIHRERDDIPSTSSLSLENDGNESIQSPSTLSRNMSPPASVQLNGGNTMKVGEFDTERHVPTAGSTTNGGMLTMLNMLSNNNTGSNKRLKFHDTSTITMHSNKSAAAPSPSILLEAALKHQQLQQQQQQQAHQQPSSCFSKWRLKPLPQSSPLSDVQQPPSNSNDWVMSPAGNHQTPLSLMLNSPTKQPVKTRAVPPLKIVSSMLKNGTTNGHVSRTTYVDEDVKSKIKVARTQLAQCKDQQREMQRVKRQLTDEVESMRTRHSDDVRHMRSLKGKISWMDSHFNDLRRQLGDTAYQQVEDEVLAEQHAQNAAAADGLRANVLKEAGTSSSNFLLNMTKDNGSAAVHDDYLDDDEEAALENVNLLAV